MDQVVSALKKVGKAMVVVGIGFAGWKATKFVAKKAAAAAGVSIPLLK